MTRQLRLGLVASALLALEIILYLWVDRPVSEYLRQVDATHPAIIDFFRSYTDLGKGKWYLWPSGLGVVFIAALFHWTHLSRSTAERLELLGNRLLFVFICVASSGLATDIIKRIIGRARPVEWSRDGLYGFHPINFKAAWNSMPSGHATTAFALAFALAQLFPRQRLLWFAYGIMLSLSRVMVNAHYMSDVIAGSMIGYVAVCLTSGNFNHNGKFLASGCLFPIDTKTHNT